MKPRTQEFKTPPMSASILGLTLVLGALPVVLLLYGLGQRSTELTAVAGGLFLLYAGVWCWMRPSGYVVDVRGLTIVWPWRSRLIPAADVAAARVMNAQEVRREVGFAARIGVGGLFGGFGLLWTRRRGLVQFYITRTDQFVWVERRSGRPLLISAENPERLLASMEEVSGESGTETASGRQ